MVLKSLFFCFFFICSFYLKIAGCSYSFDSYNLHCAVLKQKLFDQHIICVFSTVGDILSTMRDVQYHRDVMKNIGDILSTVGIFSTMEAM